MSEYTQGVCQDGAAILEDGKMLTIEEIFKKLRELSQLQEVQRWRSVDEELPEGKFIGYGTCLEKEEIVTHKGGGTFIDEAGEELPRGEITRWVYIPEFKDGES